MIWQSVLRCLWHRILLQNPPEKQEKKERLKESVSETMDSAKSGLGKIFKKDRKAIEAEKGETIDE